MHSVVDSDFLTLVLHDPVKNVLRLQQDTYESYTISLGAVRLKIIDLAAGGQPMASEDGNTVLVFNGEIYNHRELRAELAADGSGPDECVPRTTN